MTRFYYLIIIFSALFLIPAFASANEPSAVEIYFFYGQGCPASSEEIIFLAGLTDKYPQVRVKSYEVYYNDGNQAYLQKMCRQCGCSDSNLPILFIGDEYVIGFEQKTTARKIETSVEKLIATQTSLDHDQPKSGVKPIFIFSLFFAIVIFFIYFFRRKKLIQTYENKTY